MICSVLKLCIRVSKWAIVYLKDIIVNSTYEYLVVITFECFSVTWKNKSLMIIWKLTAWQLGCLERFRGLMSIMIFSTLRGKELLFLWWTSADIGILNLELFSNVIKTGLPIWFSGDRLMEGLFVTFRSLIVLEGNSDSVLRDANSLWG